MTSDLLLKKTLQGLEAWAQKEDQRLESLAFAKMLQPVKPFPPQQCNDDAKEKRLHRCAEDYWYFDKTYFPPEAYDDYAAPGKFHKELISIAGNSDKKAHILHGPRESGKTITYKKHIVWLTLFGKRKFIAIGSSVLLVPQAFLLDIIYMLENNDRIAFDFDLKWIEKSTEKIFIRNMHNPRGTFILALSEDRSARGKQRMFSRPDFIYVTDFENTKTSFTKEAVMKRIETLNEMRTSLSSKGTLVWEGNNLDINCAMNKIKTESEDGSLSPEFQYHHFPAWDDARDPKNIWHSKFPASTESELKKLMKPMDDFDWLSNFQGSPQFRSGKIFPKDYYQEADAPSGLQSVIYVDPNLSLKDQGDTTAIVNLAYDPRTDNYYITSGRCKSYSASNHLLDDLLSMWIVERLSPTDVITIGMDGNVAQESVWANNIANYTSIKKMPYPNVKFKKYNVDALATNFEDKWKARKVFFPVGFSKTEEGQLFTRQVFSFVSKKNNKKDDAPDTLICAYTLMVEEGIAFILDNSNEPIASFLSKRAHRV